MSTLLGENFASRRQSDSATAAIAGEAKLDSQTYTRTKSVCAVAASSFAHETLAKRIGNEDFPLIIIVPKRMPQILTKQDENEVWIQRYKKPCKI